MRGRRLTSHFKGRVEPADLVCGVRAKTFSNCPGDSEFGTLSVKSVTQVRHHIINQSS